MAKWQGKVEAELKKTKAEEAWSHLKDFCSLHKFLPSLSTCRKIDGMEGTPGCVRYCAGPPDPNGSLFWAKEKLVSYDDMKRSYSYVIVDNNIGFGDYFATLKVIEGGFDNFDGCKIEWLFGCDPIVGWAESDFVGYMENGIKEMAKRIENGV